MEAWITWLIIILILSFVEIITINLVTIWFVASAAIALVVSLFTESFYIQFIVFGVCGLLIMVFTRPLLKKLLKKDKPVTLTDGIDIYLKLCRMQCFQDGNKRCANLLANHFLIHNCIGILSIDVNLIEEYKTKLIQYYETGMSFDIQIFLQTNCIFNENKLR